MIVKLKTPFKTSDTIIHILKHFKNEKENFFFPILLHKDTVGRICQHKEYGAARVFSSIFSCRYARINK